MKMEMSAELFHKIELPGCLPSDNARVKSLLISHGKSYNGFSLLRQIIRPYFPYIQESTKPVQPTWSTCDVNI